jgi:hypothetical protein
VVSRPATSFTGRSGSYLRLLHRRLKKFFALSFDSVSGSLAAASASHLVSPYLQSSLSALLRLFALHRTSETAQGSASVPWILFLLWLILARSRLPLGLFVLPSQIPFSECRCMSDTLAGYGPRFAVLRRSHIRGCRLPALFSSTKSLLVQSFRCASE